MDFCPQSPQDVEKLKKAVGITDIDELFKDINPDKLNPALNLPEAMDEYEVSREIDKKLKKNLYENYISFLGAGSYDHYVPAVVDEISGRGEFYTAYTPYQAEVSQGTLQTIYEFQSMICSITEMDVSNASMYDGATALAEAVVMSFREKKKAKKVLIAANINPFYKSVINTYLAGYDYEIVYIPYDKEGKLDIEFLKKYDYSEISAIVVQNPNFFGFVED